jgi:hypothetical protein
VAAAGEVGQRRFLPGGSRSYETNGALLADMPKERVIETCNAFLKAKDLR